MITRALTVIVCHLVCWAALPAGEALDLGGGERIELCPVAAGSTYLGSAASESGRGSDEDFRTVRISADFLIGSVPVTRGQFARFVASTGYRTEAETGTSGGWGLDGGTLVQRRDFTWRKPGFAQDDRHPVVLVTWGDAQAFCDWASRQTGRSVALPSEAEWEYACHGGDGGTWLGPAHPAVGGTSAVGGDAANPLGLHDLLGHVNQWCRDWYQASLPASAVDPLIDQPPAGETPRRCLRGGSFLQTSRQRAAARWRNAPGTRNADNGFRVIVRGAAVAATATTAPPAPIAPAAPEVESARAPVMPPQAWEPSPPAQQRAPGLPSSSFIGIGGWGILGFIGVMAVIFLRKIFASASPQNSSAGFDSRRREAASQITAKTRDDGFWIDTQGLPKGARLRYRVLRDGRWIDDQVTVVPAPAGQFVYTGWRPEQIIVQGIAGTTLARSVTQSGFQSQPPRRNPPPSRPFSTPSAY